MITASKIDALLEPIIRERKDYNYKVENPRKDSRLKKQCEFYRVVKSCLEHNPTQEFIKKEIDRISNRLQAIDREFKYWHDTHPATGVLNPKTVYERELGVPDLKQQLRALQFIYHS